MIDNQVYKILFDINSIMVWKKTPPFIEEQNAENPLMFADYLLILFV
jgi:hypothetical protein